MRRELEKRKSDLFKSLIDCRIGSSRAQEIRKEIEEIEEELKQYPDEYPDFVLRERVM